MNDLLLHKYRNEFRSGNDLSPEDSEDLFGSLVTSDDVKLIAELLLAWNDKGTSDDELFLFASIMRRRMKRIDLRSNSCVDIVGTGGSGAKTFNVSTAAALVISGAGVPVAKHGNRAATSKSGSFDCLSLLGVNADVDPSITQQCFDELRICFMFAPRFHALSLTLAEARRSLRAPSVFNNLGPLCNPASAPHQVIGVWNTDLIGKTAGALARLGTKRSWIVHGDGGLDEIALIGETLVAEICEQSIQTFTITAKDFGIDYFAGNLSNCTATESANLIKEILNNMHKGEDDEKLALINAAAAIYIATRASSLRSAYSIAEESLRSGAAMETLTKLVELTKQ
ncbi:MAG: anthranilate phosphoribosyltransferase [Pyrinomonadaceae bacterium]